MRIAVHDYGGYRFALELSRELAARGHEVLHLYCSDVARGEGGVGTSAADPPRLTVQGATIGRTFEKYSARRFADERAYGRVAAAHIRRFDPRVVLSGNTPLLSQALLLAEARRRRRRFVYWWHDSYGVGVRHVVRRRRPGLASVFAAPFESLEKWMLRRSDHVVAISEGLRDHARRWGVDGREMSVIANWAPADDLPGRESEDSWRTAHGLAGRPLVVYSGTLGLKHDPELLMALASKLQGSDALVVVASQGPGRELLERRRTELGLQNLRLLDYQSYDQFGAMLAAADVLVAIIEADAAQFSVPSKVFAYLRAGRPVVASMPSDNQAAEVLRSADAGICVPPDDPDAFVSEVVRLLGDPDLRRRLGDNGLRYATTAFDVGAIADRFEHVLRGPRPAPRRFGPVGIGVDTVRRIWSHPLNRHRRLRALATYAGWQTWERTARRPWTVPLTPTRRIRCYPHCPVTAAVLYYRLPDPDEMRFLLDVLATGDVFVDVGAHAGVYSVLASSVPGVRVVAVEPSSASFARLVENVDLNAIGEQVTPLRLALGDRQGAGRVSTGRDSMNSLVADEAGEPVALTTVDGLVRDLDLGPVAAMKVDVEGAELDVLAGAEHTIGASRPLLIVEVNDAEGVKWFADRERYTCVRYEGGVLAPAPIEAFEGRNALLVGDVDEAQRRLRR